MFQVYVQGQEVRLKTSKSKDINTFYPKDTKFEITREIWPDSWLLKDPYGMTWEVSTLMLHEDFYSVEKTKTIPVPPTLKKWLKETLASRG